MTKFNCKLCRLFTVFILTMSLFICPSITYGEVEDPMLSKDITIPLYLTAHDNLSGVSNVMISNYSDFRDSEWENYCEEKEFTFDKDAEEKTIYIKYMDNAGNVSKVYSKVIPGNFFEETIFINEEDLYTNKSKIILNIKTDENAKEFSLSSDSKDWSSWEEFRSEIEYDIKGDNGTKEIYIQFKNNNGEIIQKFVPGVFVYDETPPTIENIQLSLDENTNKVNVSADINDNLSGIQYKKWASGQVNLDYFKNQGTDFNENTIVIDKNGIYTIYAADKAGNASIENFTVDTIVNTIKDTEKENINNINNAKQNVNNNNIEKKPNKIVNKTNKNTNTNSNAQNKTEEENNTNKTDDKKASANIKESTNKETVDNIKTSDKKHTEKNTVSKEENTKENNKITNDNISNDKNKNTNKKASDNKILKYWWILLLLLLLIIYRLYKKYKEKNNRS